MKKSGLLLLLAGIMVFSSCKKSTEDFQTPAIQEYAPYTVGKYITYKLDSLVYINFGSSSQVRSYEVKYLVESKLPDTSNGTSFRIIRYIRKSAANSFNPDATFEAIYKNNSLEFVENNQRFIKLKQPIRNGYSWKGNSYIDTYSLTSEVRYLEGWDYTYDSVGVAAIIGAFSLDNTIKVNQRNEVIGNPTDVNSYSEINKGVEKYAKGIGLVYRLFFHNEYQPPTPGRGGYYQGYGITLTMIDHN
ncbi:MAG: hypothetical protein ABIP80_00730 [Ferruginibacter sp.]